MDHRGHSARHSFKRVIRISSALAVRVNYPFFDAKNVFSVRAESAVFAVSANCFIGIFIKKLAFHRPSYLSALNFNIFFFAYQGQK